MSALSPTALPEKVKPKSVLSKNGGVQCGTFLRQKTVS